jgi:glycine/D-amino acid oxidase-like deaminating enzyme
VAEDRVGPVRTQVAVVGGGIAGAWLAYRLARNDIPAVLISADACWPPLSRAWSAAAREERSNRRLITNPVRPAGKATTRASSRPLMLAEQVERPAGRGLLITFGLSFSRGSFTMTIPDGGWRP